MQQPEEEEEEVADWIDDDLIELDLIDPLYDDGRIVPNITGRRDQRTLKRKGRVVQRIVRLHPRVAAMVDFIMLRDTHEHLTDLFVIMLQAYCKTYGRVRKSDLPPDQELIKEYLTQVSKKHEKELDRQDGQGSGARHGGQAGQQPRLPGGHP